MGSTTGTLGYSGRSNDVIVIDGGLCGHTASALFLEGPEAEVRHLLVNHVCVTEAPDGWKPLEPLLQQNVYTRRLSTFHVASL